MVTGVASHTRGRRARALFVGAGLAAAMAGVLGGCEDEDPAASAIQDASIHLKTVSPGSVPPVSDEFATERYRATASKLGPASSGSAGLQAAAAMLSTQVESGLARPAMNRLAEIEHEIGRASCRERV